MTLELESERRQGVKIVPDLPPVSAQFGKRDELAPRGPKPIEQNHVQYGRIGRCRVHGWFSDLMISGT
jgi:hypothetical protein